MQKVILRERSIEQRKYLEISWGGCRDFFLSAHNIKKQPDTDSHNAVIAERERKGKLPSMVQWYLIHENLVEINKALKKMHGQELKGWYWVDFHYGSLAYNVDENIFKILTIGWCRHKLHSRVVLEFPE